MAAITICSDFGTQEKKVSHFFRCFPVYLPWRDGTRCRDLSFLNVEFWASFLTVIKRLFSSSSLSAIRVVSPAYLRLWIFLPAILIPACASSSLTFCIMYSAYKLNKQGDNIQPWCTPFPIWNQSIVLLPCFPLFECPPLSSSLLYTCWVSVQMPLPLKLFPINHLNLILYPTLTLSHCVFVSYVLKFHLLIEIISIL